MSTKSDYKKVVAPAFVESFVLNAIFDAAIGNTNGKHDCSICGTTFEGYGNNPAPVTSEGRACDSCNATKVIPARIARLDSGLTPNW
jgi:hypothetical protein